MPVFPVWITGVCITARKVIALPLSVHVRWNRVPQKPLLKRPEESAEPQGPMSIFPVWITGV